MFDPKPPPPKPKRWKCPVCKTRRSAGGIKGARCGSCHFNEESRDFTRRVMRLQPGESFYYHGVTIQRSATSTPADVAALPLHTPTLLEKEPDHE